MATERDVVEVILRPMTQLYTPPDGMHGKPKLEQVKAQFVDALKPYSRETLEKAWKRVRSTHYGWHWPTLQEVIRECNLCS